MTTMRKTSKDYRNELISLTNEQLALESRIRARAKEMIIANPDISMGINNYANAPHKEIFVKDYLIGIDNDNMFIVFDVMETIERHLASKHPHYQTEIKF